MTEIDFQKYQNIFKEKITDIDLIDNLDGKFVSRIFEKIGDDIPTNILSHLIVYNKHMVDENYNAALDFKSRIMIR